MNMSIKTFACAATASMLFLACNVNEQPDNLSGLDKEKKLAASPGSSEPNPPEMICTDEIPPKCYPVADPSDKPNPSEPSEICELDIPEKCYPINKPTNKPPYDPSVSIISADVEEWMKEQLVSKSGEKKLIKISDMHKPEETWAKVGLSATINSAGETEYFLDGKKISVEEYKSKLAEYESQKTDKGKRDLSIPGEIISFDRYSWNVLMTAEQVVELSKKYGELAIEFYIEYVEY